MSIEYAITCEKQLRELMSWMRLGRTIAQYEGKCHSLRMDLGVSNTFAYCGQEYAGAKNYHDAPKWFHQYVLAELQKDIPAAVHRAYEAAARKLCTEIEAARNETDALLNSVKADENKKVV